MADTRFEVASGAGTDLVEDLAGAGSRAYAYVLDWHVRVLLVIAWYIACMAFLRTPDLFGVGKGAELPVLLWMNVPPALLYLLYHPVLELMMEGNSPGKRWAGVRIVDERGAPPGPGAILIRNIFRLVDGLPAMYTVGLVTIMLTRRQVRLGDMVAGTVAVKSGERVSLSLQTVERMHAARVDAKTAELVIELLERRRSTRPEQWNRLGEAVLAREGVALEKNDQKSIRAALQALLQPE